MYLCHPLYSKSVDFKLNYTWRNIILAPFSWLYGSITTVRNWLYDRGILSSRSFDLPVISIGNLAVGGTGKTPHVEFILNLLKPDKKIAILSRGYKRKTKGFVLADKNTNSKIIGDEPFQIFSKNRDVIVAVDEKRVHGIDRLCEIYPDLQVVILDDAFQHRQVNPGLSILLTDFSNLYTRDSHLPGGNLRESKKDSKRADIIIITKCPVNISPIEMRLIEKEIKIKPHQSLFFSSYIYNEIKPVFPDYISEIMTYNKIKKAKTDVLLVAGIVSPQPIVEQINRYTNSLQTLFFKDHHTFQRQDLRLIENKLNKMAAQEKIILVTEKDAARIVSMTDFPESLKSMIYTIPIRVKILHDQEQIFTDKIISYVAENSRNS